MCDQESGPVGQVSTRQHIKSLCRQTNPEFQHCFQFLIVFCLSLLFFFYMLSSNSLSWWENVSLHEHYLGLFNQSDEATPSPYPLDHILFVNITLNETAESPTIPPVGTEYHHAYPRNYRFIMDNTEACKNETPFLVLMVPVAPYNVKARDAIRQTWANNSVVQGEVVLTLFMLGITGRDDFGRVQEQLRQENLKTHDLIQSNFLDSYLNLTIKTMVIMDWLATHCSTAAYGMKIDSDMFLNIDNLVIMLKHKDIPKENYLTGMILWNKPVIRLNDSKWYVPKELYPEDTYPNYVQGMGYVFSNDLPEKFVEMSKSIQPFNVEDAYIGMCMKKLGLSPWLPPDSSQFREHHEGFDRCEFSKAITYILWNSDELVKYWTELKKPGPPC